MSVELRRLHSAGRLNPALSLLLDTRAALHHPTATALAPFDALGGALLDREQPMSLRSGALQDALAVLDTFEDEAFTEDELGAFPEPLRDVAGRALNDRGWRRLSPQIHALDLEFDGEAHARILRLPPGVKTPTHTHEAREYTLVLTGAFHDGHKRYGPGDVCVADDSVTHRPVAEPGEICFALAVEEGDLKFTGALGMLQRAFSALQ